MKIKEIAKSVIDTLPEEANMDDIIHALYVRAKFEQGIHEIENGKGVSHEEAKKIMRNWINKFNKPSLSL